jgi:hypothetical protein
MINERRWGFVVGGLIIMGPGLALGSLLLIASDNCFPDNCQARPTELIPLAGIEAVGLAFLIVGLVGHDVPAGPTPPAQNLTFLPFVTPEAEGLSMSMRW